MKILGIETSCDETAASVVEIAKDTNHATILSNVTATSLALHAKTGGIIPEIAARNQIQDIIPVIYEALVDAKCLEQSAKSEKENSMLYALCSMPAIDAIAVTYGPGLIGSLLVGVETAKTLSYIWKKPLIPVNHLFGHIYANWITVKCIESRAKSNQNSTRYALNATPRFPAIGLIISGGHTDLLLMKSHSDITWLGGTRDDAAGEAFDKIGRMVGLEYPAGPMIEQLSKSGNPKSFHFPRPLMYDKAFDFSFSGLKTAVLREVEKFEAQGIIFSQDGRRSPVPRKNLFPSEKIVADICRSVQDAISDVIVYKTLLATEKFHVKSIIIGGGVAANETLVEKLKQSAISHKLSAEIFVPPKSLCTDNAAMIASAAFFQGKQTPWEKITANPELYFD